MVVTKNGGTSPCFRSSKRALHLQGEVSLPVRPGISEIALRFRPDEKEPTHESVRHAKACRFFNQVYARIKRESVLLITDYIAEDPELQQLMAAQGSRE